MSTGLYERLSRISALTPARRREPASQPEARDPAALLTMLGAGTARNRYGEFLVARQWYATPEMCNPDDDVLRLLLPTKSGLQACALQEAANPDKWLFLDTETTGLAGGTGTYAFLIGLAWWESGGIRIEQLFMRDHDEEHSILLEVARRLEEHPVLVTFNGKCFDWPLLQNRFRMTRQIDVPELAAHLDFLHPARQLWRLQIGSTRLADLEEKVLGAKFLGWSRRGDIDSSRIPEFYFEFLRRGAAEGIAGVFHHNRMDLRGLAALAGRIFLTLSEPEHGGREPLELYGISRLLNHRGEYAKARGVYERCLDAGLPEAIDRRARHEAAKLARRERDFGRATELWHGLANSKESSLEALEQLAIHYERRDRNYREAVRVTHLALGQLRNAYRLGLIRPKRHANLSARLRQRLIRLEANVHRLAALDSA
jgi:uncharacterized protein YprB with RNaseH-like and TPR domain